MSAVLAVVPPPELQDVLQAADYIRSLQSEIGRLTALNDQLMQQAEVRSRRMRKLDDEILEARIEIENLRLARHGR